MIYKKFLYAVIIVILVSFCGLTGGVCLGRENAIVATVDRNKIYENENLVLTVKLYGATTGDKLYMPEFHDFDVVSQSKSAQMTIVNSKRTDITILTFVLSPMASGKYTIDSATLQTKDSKYTTPPISVEVLPFAPYSSNIPSSTQNSSAQAFSGNGIATDIENGDKAFVELISEPNEAFVGQQVTLIFRLYIRNMNVADLNYTEPKMTGFMEEELGPKNNYYKNVNGYRYSVVELKKAIFPLSEGEHTIEPAVMSIYHRVETILSFFNKREDIATKPLTIKVKPLPTKNKPAEFNNAVGDFNIVTSVSAKTVKVGEPVTLRMRVFGKGNTKTITFPKMDNIEGFKSYEPEIKNNIEYKQDTIVGEKVWEKIFVPKTAGTHTIHVPDFNFFNPYKKTYEVVKGSSVDILVENLSDQERTQGSLIVQGSDLATDNNEKANLIRQNNGINFIKTGKIKFKKHTPTGLFYLGFFGLPLLVFLFFLFHYKKISKIKTDVRYARKLKAGRKLNKTLKAAKKAIKKEDVVNFYLCADKAVRECVSNKTAIPSAGLTVDTVVDILQKKNIAKTVISDVCDILDKCDMVKFVSAKVSPAETEADYNKLREILAVLLKKL